MAHSYTPGLRVSSRTVVARERRLPLAGTVVVQSGEAVEATTTVARTDLPGDVTNLHVANLLGVDAADVPHMMLVKEGDAVAKEQTIARSGGFLGFFKSEVQAPIPGTIESVSKITGQVLVRAAPRPLTVEAYVKGRVGEVYPDQGVSVTTQAVFVQGIFGIGGEARGKLVVVAPSPDAALDPGSLGPDVEGAVVVGGAFADLAGIRKAIECKASALVVGGVPYIALRELLGYSIGVAVTGAEDVGLTLIVTEGFGKIPMARRTFDLLKANVGREASVNGATQIRAGVIRPEILIALDDGDDGAVEVEEAKGLDMGSPVRVIREPYFGLRGAVAGLPPELHTLEMEGKVRVAEIELEDGRTVTVPRSNLERMEE